MAEDRPRTGDLLATVGAALLAVSVFQPWYALTLTASGASSAQQALNRVAQQFGNAAFQSQATRVGNAFNTFAGQQLATVSAHQLLKYLSVALLILAAAAFIAALSRLGGASQVGDGQIALLGLAAALCVLFRMLDRPATEEGALTLSLHWGIWLALGSCLAIIVGGLWPHSAASANGSTAAPDKLWEGRSGWTPEA
jgi:hypothetical protein